MKKKTTATSKKKAATESKTIAKTMSSKSIAVKKVAEEPTPAKSLPEKTAKKKLPMPCVTTIIATADLGWGNQLYLRGEGGGLSWESGIPMTCNGADEWVWVSTANEPIFQFKFVLNDKFWSLGDNLIATRGETHKTYPAF